MRISRAAQTLAASAALAVAVMAAGAAPAAAQGRNEGQLEGSAPVEERQIELIRGEQMTIPAEGVAKYSPSNDVIDVRLPRDAREFIVVGAKAGTATLLLVMRDGRQIAYVINVRSDTVKKRDNIRLDFYFVELSRSSAYQVGIGWPGTVAGSAKAELTKDLATGAAAGSAVVAAQVLPRIDLAQEGGWARIYRQASVIVANGEQGAFNTGGEVNVRVEGALATGLDAIKFGSSVQVQPRYDRQSGRIEIRIVADISELSESGVDGLPGRIISTLSTLVNVELGQSIVLAGADSRSASRSSAGLPLLSRIPVLGFLFGSQAGSKAHTENFILIVPTVIEAYDLSDREMVERALSVFSEFEGDHGQETAMERVAHDRPKQGQK